MKQLLNVAAIFSDFPDRIAIFQKEKQKWICTSGVFPLMQGQVPSCSLGDTGALFQTQISTRDTRKIPRGEGPLYNKVTIIKSKNWLEF